MRIFHEKLSYVPIILVICSQDNDEMINKCLYLIKSWCLGTEKEFQWEFFTLPVYASGHAVYILIFAFITKNNQKVLRYFSGRINHFQ